MTASPTTTPVETVLPGDWPKIFREYAAVAGEADAGELARLVAGWVAEVAAAREAERLKWGWGGVVAPPTPVKGPENPPAKAGYWWFGGEQKKTKYKPMAGWCAAGAPRPAGAKYWTLPGWTVWVRFLDPESR